MSDSFCFGGQNSVLLLGRNYFDVCANKNTSHSFNYAMSDSFGFGGQNSVLLLGRN